MNDTSIDNSSLSQRYKVVIVGDVSVGKTSYISRITENKFNSSYEPSIGVDFSSKQVKYKGSLFKLQIWDTAGQEKYKSLIPSYIRSSNIVYIMYDITNKSSFENINKWVLFIEKYVPEANILIIGNKIDLNDNRQVSKDDVDKFKKESKYSIYEISSKTGENCYEVFYASLKKLNVLNDFLDTEKELISFLIEENKVEGSMLFSVNNINNSISKSNRIKSELYDGKIVENSKTDEKINENFRISSWKEKNFSEFKKKRKCEC